MKRTRQPAIEDAETAISYRTPMSVVKTVRYPFITINGDHYIEYPVCPRCNISMEMDFQSYCDRCGQKLDWSHR